MRTQLLVSASAVLISPKYYALNVNAPSAVRKALQRVSGGTHLAAFDARDVGLRGLHAPRQLRLRQARCGARLDQRTGKVELFTEKHAVSSTSHRQERARQRRSACDVVSFSTALL